MRVVFLGNHNVGIKALEAISETEEIAGVIAHPLDPEDGIRYQSVYDFAFQNGWNAIRSTGKDPELERFIRDAKPDLLLIADYRYLLSKSILHLAPFGVVNLHPSLLPKYRGRAPVNWAILNGEANLGLTAHFVDDGMDTGDIIEQVTFELKEEQDVGDALQILYPLYYQLTKKVLEYFKSGHVPRKPQDHSQATVFPRRRPEDGRIRWDQSLNAIRNLVRAVSFPYPGAFTTLSNHKIIVWKAQTSHLIKSGEPLPGMVLHIGPEGIHVQCGNGILLLTQIEVVTNKKQPVLCSGVIFDTF